MFSVVSLHSGHLLQVELSANSSLYRCPFKWQCPTRSLFTVLLCLSTTLQKYIPKHYMEMSGQFYILATLHPRKESPLLTG